ncbi:MAG: serine kinase, partial [Deltaproteobacteria bacterium]|nr:serine kinase [Deltaproteobacteria bacterium]
SDVIGKAEAGNVWITMQVHQNIVAVAVLKNLAGIILVNNREPLPDTLEKAQKENVVILKCSLSAFDTAGKLYAHGIRGKSESVNLPN